MLEGFHAVKHALRFGARILHLCTRDPDRLRSLARDLAPDLVARLPAAATLVTESEFRQLAPNAHETGVIALARRPDPPPAMATVDPHAPLVLLDHPSHLGNIGATVRVAAAADAAGVVTICGPDPWHPAAIRGSGGLHFALPVWRQDLLEAPGRPVIAVDPAGESLDEVDIPDEAILIFGAERDGVSDPLLRLSGQRTRIPMRPGVSSLNLATAVAVVLYAWRARRKRL